ILVDRQLLPLTTQIQDLQNIVEDLVQAQLRCRTTAPDGEMRQDKLLELRTLQLRRKRLPHMRFRHSGPQKTRPYPIQWRRQKFQDKGALQPNSTAFKNPQPVAGKRSVKNALDGRQRSRDQVYDVNRRGPLFIGLTGSHRRGI